LTRHKKDAPEGTPVGDSTLLKPIKSLLGTQQAQAPFLIRLDCHLWPLGLQGVSNPAVQLDSRPLIYPFGVIASNFASMSQALSRIDSGYRAAALTLAACRLLRPCFGWHGNKTACRPLAYRLSTPS
jgi:hypothetical protein